MNLAVSPAADPSRAAAWIDGFLRASGEVLYHDDALFGIFDGWLSELAADAFPALLPMLRRTFGGFAPPLRRSLGERAARSKRTATSPAAGAASPGIELDHERAETVLPLISRMLGLGGETRS